MVWFSVNNTPHDRGLVQWWFLGPSFGRIARLLAPQVQVKEEIRLVTIIDQIDKEVSIIPRGALFKTPMGPIHVNRTFEGEFSGPSPGQGLPSQQGWTHVWGSGKTCHLGTPGRNGRWKWAEHGLCVGPGFDPSTAQESHLRTKTKAPEPQNPN